MIELATAWAIGMVRGVSHAFEPDHLAAIGTLVSERNESESHGRRRVATVGLAWGVGHGAVLAAAGAVFQGLRWTVSSQVERACELGVALMLVVLGLRAVVHAVRCMRAGSPEEHSHGRLRHSHRAPHVPHVHVRQWTFAWRPLLVGGVHGLAGSGALTALAFASLPTFTSGLVYIACFAVGAACSMALLTGLLGAAASRLAHGTRWTSPLSAATGLASVALGIYWGMTHLAG
jgi:hypothetical protein